MIGDTIKFAHNCTYKELVPSSITDPIPNIISGKLAKMNLFKSAITECAKSPGLVNYIILMPPS